MMVNYEDFAIAIDSPRNQTFQVRVRTITGQEFRGTVKLPLNDKQYLSFLDKVAFSDAVSEDEVIDFGRLLYRILFQGRVAEAFQTAKDQAKNRGNALRISLSIEPDLVAVAALPWEFCADEAGMPLAIEHSFCRYIPRTEPIPSMGLVPGEALRLMITSALPSDVSLQYPLDVDAEIKGIRLALDPLVKSKQITIVEVPHLTGLKLYRALGNEKPHIVHHIGHGVLKDAMGYLVLEDDNGKRKDMSARQWSSSFHGTDVRLIILNACKTSMVTTQLLRGIAPALLYANIPAIVGMQSSVLDRVGCLFAEEFYRALVKGLAVDRCVALGRKAIIADGTSHLDWGLITLYMRAVDGKLFNTHMLQSTIPSSHQQEIETTMPIQDMSRISESRPLLVGVLADLSSTTRSVLKQAQTQNRLSVDSLSKTLKSLVDDLIRYCRTTQGKSILPKIYLFAYGDGFGDKRQQLDTLIQQFFLTTPQPIAQGSIRDLLTIQESDLSIPITPSAKDLHEYHDQYMQVIEDHGYDLSAQPPDLSAGLTIIYDRFIQELPKRPYHSSLCLLLSTGVVSDSELPSLLKMSQSLQQHGINILTGYIGNQDICAPFTLYSEPKLDWPLEAQRLFRLSSRLDRHSSQSQQIIDLARNRGWSVPEAGTLFVQVNQTDMLQHIIDIYVTSMK